MQEAGCGELRQKIRPVVSTTHNSAYRSNECIIVTKQDFMQRLNYLYEYADARYTEESPQYGPTNLLVSSLCSTFHINDAALKELSTRDMKRIPDFAAILTYGKRKSARDQARSGYMVQELVEFLGTNGPEPPADNNSKDKNYAYKSRKPDPAALGPARKTRAASRAASRASQAAPSTASDEASRSPSPAIPPISQSSKIPPLPSSPSSSPHYDDGDDDGESSGETHDQDFDGTREYYSESEEERWDENELNKEAPPEGGPNVFPSLPVHSNIALHGEEKEDHNEGNGASELGNVYGGDNEEILEDEDDEDEDEEWYALRRR
ncbi:hypothetical protein K488DRAFT_67109 [Vararia minispora EC-137]|uniref:Uncharacterized protein n=1 Tax=Vararia minispora EC-137 TaxID=1314806 RepID=A0ACB8QZH8_9AGAM|nr:hypothetical protein K488DRAFT_67109 [Vararia minispora EC-137]